MELCRNVIKEQPLVIKNNRFNRKLKQQILLLILMMQELLRQYHLLAYIKEERKDQIQFCFWSFNIQAKNRNILMFYGGRKCIKYYLQKMNY